MQYAPLSQLADLNPSVDTSSLDPDSPVTFLGMADVSEEGDILQRHRRPYREVQYGYTPFQEEDVLVAKITPCLENGKGAHATDLMNGVGFGSTEFHVLRAKSGVSPRYLYYWTQFTDFRLAAEASMIGSAGQQRVQPYLYDEFEVPAFDLDEQLRIARVLDAVDAAIRRTDRVVDKLDHVRQGLLHDLLTRGLTADGALRDPGAHPEQFRDSPLGRVPKTWTVHSLEDVGTWASGGTPSKSIEKYWDGEIPWVTPKDMKHVHLSSTTDHLTEEGASRVRRVPEGTTFIVVRGMVLAHTFRVSHAGREMTFNQDVRAIIPDESKVTPEFLTYWFLANEHDLLRLVTEATHGTKRLDVGQLLDFPIAVPPQDEQKLIVERLANAETRVEREKDRSDKLQNLKRGLMRDLLTGEVRITEDVERRVAEVTGRSAATAAS